MITISDITQRPDLQPLIFNITKHDSNAISAGYLFVAPYAQIMPAAARYEYVSCQVGPHIYDNDGVRRTGAQSWTISNNARSLFGVEPAWSRIELPGDSR